jgi:hypothetical protein
MSTQGNLEKTGIYTGGGQVRIPGFRDSIGRGKNIYIDAANGSASATGMTPEQAVTTLALAVAKLRTGKNDIIRLIAGTTAVNLAAKLTWSYNCCHLIGEGAFGRMNMRSRIGHSANFATLLDVTGYGNTFANLYFMYGRGSATNSNLLTVTGDRNSFINCHFGGPMHATEGGTASFNLATILGTENYFKNCTFGISTINVSAAITAIKFGGSGYDPRTIFEDCTFILKGESGGAGSYFLQTVSGVGEAFGIFRNCMFLNTGSTVFTYAIDGAGSAAQKLYFDKNSFFAGCTDIVALASEANVICGLSNSDTTYAAKLGNLLATQPDVS